MSGFLDEITRRYGRDAATGLAAAYETVILTMSRGRADGIPDRAVRARLLDAMLSEGRLHGFDATRLTEAALATGRERPAA